MNYIGLFRLAQSNLQLLYQHDLDNLTADGLRFRVLKTDERSDVAKVNAVLAYLVQIARLPDPKHRLWIKQEGLRYVSPGHILNPILKIFKKKILSEEQENRQLVILRIGDQRFEVEKEAVAAASTVLQNALLGSFKESSLSVVTLYLPIETKPENIELLINALQTDELPRLQLLEDYVDLAVIFDYLNSEELLNLCSQKIANSLSSIEDVICLYAANPEVAKHVFKKLTPQLAEALRRSIYFLTPEWVRKLKGIPISNANGAIVEIEFPTWSCSLQESMLDLVNICKLPIDDDCLDFLEPHLERPTSGNL